MLHNQSRGAESLVGGLGAPAAVEDLPPRYNRRWTTRQKGQVLDAIDRGVLTAAEAILHYALAPNDLPSWRKAAADRPAATAADLPMAEASRSAEPMSRLIEVLLSRGLIDAFDAASIERPCGGGPHDRRPQDERLAAIFARFIVDDAPIV